MIESSPSRIPPPPIHPLAALATLVLDGVFGVIEILDPFALIFTSVGIGLLGAVTTALVQHFLAKEEWGPSIAKGLVMGIVAGVPYPVAGTAVGAPLLIWAGVHQWVRLPGSGNNQLVDETFNSPQLEDAEKTKEK